MYMVFHAIDNVWLVSIVLDNARHIFKHFLSPFLVQEILTSVHGKDDLNVDL